MRDYLAAVALTALLRDNDDIDDQEIAIRAARIANRVADNIEAHAAARHSQMHGYGEAVTSGKCARRPSDGSLGYCNRHKNHAGPCSWGNRDGKDAAAD